MTSTTTQLAAPRGLPLSTVHGAMLRAARWSFLAGCVAVSVMVARIGSYTVGDMLLLGAAGLVALTPTRGWLPRPRGISAAAFFTTVVMLGGLLAVSASAAPSQSFLVLVRLGILVVLIPWLLAVLFPDEGGLRRVLVATGVGGALNGLATIGQMTLGLQIPGAQISSADRFSGLTGHVSDTGAICGLGVVVGFGLLGHHTWRRSDLAAATILVLNMVGLVLSGSVAGMIAAVVGCFVIVVTGGIGRRKLLWSAAGVLVAATIGTWLVSQTSNGLSPVDRLLQVLGIQSKYAGTNTSASRMVTIERGWQAFGEAPWTGIGLNNAVSNVYQDLPVHNLPVALLHVGGLVFAFGVMGVVAARVGALLREWHPGLGPIAIALFAATFWFALTAPGYYNRYFWVPVALVGAVAELAHRQRLARTRPASPRPEAPGPGAGPYHVS